MAKIDRRGPKLLIAGIKAVKPVAMSQRPNTSRPKFFVLCEPHREISLGSGREAVCGTASGWS